MMDLLHLHEKFFRPLPGTGTPPFQSSLHLRGVGGGLGPQSRPRVAPPRTLPRDPQASGEVWQICACSRFPEWKPGGFPAERLTFGLILPSPPPMALVIYRWVKPHRIRNVSRREAVVDLRYDPNTLTFFPLGLHTCLITLRI